MLEREILVIFLSFFVHQTIDHTISQPYNTIRIRNIQDGDILNPDNKIYLFEEMPVPRAIATLSIPTILSSLVMVIYNVADTFFVGMINDPVQNAAVTLAAPVLLAFNAINNLFGVGTSSMMSRAMGKHDYELVRKSSAFGFYCTLFFALCFSFFSTVFKGPLLSLLGSDSVTYNATAQYMFWTVSFGAVPAILNVVMAYMVRSEGAALHASIGQMSGCILNMFLDPLFILVFKMGASGAGLATFISNCAACLYFLLLIRKKSGNTYVCLSLKKFGFSRIVILGIFAVGIPASIQNLLNVTSMTILNNFTSSYGATVVASMGIAQKINQVPMMIALGYSNGMMPFVSYNYAAKKGKRMKEGILFVAKTMLPMLVCTSLLCLLLSENLVRIFMDNPDIIHYGSAFLRGFCLGMPFICADFLGVGVYQAIGKGQFSLAFAISRKIILEIPFLFLLGYLFPLYGLAYAQFATEFILSIAAFFMLTRILKRVSND